MTVGFGLLGAGYMGRSYAACLTRHVRNGRLVAVSSGSRAPALAAEFNCDVEPSLEAVLARHDVDAVIIATPQSVHVEQCVAAAAAGKHVYTEKPMARTVAECDVMTTACAAASVRLGVNKVLRYREAPLAARDLIRSGQIGEVRMIVARDVYAGFLIEDKKWAAGADQGPPYLDWGVHCHDLMRWLCDDEPASAFALFGSFTDEKPSSQSAMVQFAFHRGVMAQVWMSYELPPPALTPADWFLVVGSDGMVDCDTYGAVKLGRGDRWRTVAQQPAFDPLGDYLHPARLKGFAAQLQDFIDSVERGREPAVGAKDGRAAVEMAEAAELSARTGRAVSFPIG